MALNLARTYGARLVIFHFMVERTFYYWSSPENRDEMKEKRIEIGRRKALDRYGPALGNFKDYEYLSCEAGEGEAHYESVNAAQKESVEMIVLGPTGGPG